MQQKPLHLAWNQARPLELWNESLRGATCSRTCGGYLQRNESPQRRPAPQRSPHLQLCGLVPRGELIPYNRTCPYTTNKFAPRFSDVTISG